MENEKENIEPRIHLFGEDLGRSPKESKKHDFHNRCSGRDRGIGLGLIVIIAGLVLFLNNLGLVSWNFWHYVWPFWPLLLILAGVQIILGNNWFSEIVSAILVLGFLSIIITYGFIQVDSSLLGYLPDGLVEFVKNFELINNF